jgi:hypothetical protein
MGGGVQYGRRCAVWEEVCSMGGGVQYGPPTVMGVAPMGAGTGARMVVYNALNGGFLGYL